MISFLIQIYFVLVWFLKFPPSSFQSPPPCCWHVARSARAKDQIFPHNSHNTPVPFYQSGWLWPASLSCLAYQPYHFFLFQFCSSHLVGLFIENSTKKMHAPNRKTIRNRMSTLHHMKTASKRLLILKISISGFHQISYP